MSNNSTKSKKNYSTSKDVDPTLNVEKRRDTSKLVECLMRGFVIDISDFIDNILTKSTKIN